LSVALFSEPQLWALTAAMGLQLPLAALCVVPESMARRELRFKQLSVVEIVTQAGAALTTLGCAWAGLGVWALVAGHVASTSIKSAMLLLRFGSVAPRFSLRGQRELARFGGALTANRVIWYFSSQADMFIAAKLLGKEGLGVYAVAVHLATMPMQKLTAVSNQVAFSAYAKLQTDATRFRAALLESLTMMSALAVGLLWGLAGTAPTLIPLVLGSQWTAATLPLQIVAMVIPIRLSAAMLSTALIAAGHVGADLKNTLVSAAILIPAFLVGATLDGVRGLALGWALGYPVFALVLVWRACGKLPLTMASVLGSFAAPGAAGLVMLLALAAWHGFGPEAPAVLSLLAQMAIGAGSYLLGLFVLDRNILVRSAEFVGLRPSANVAKD